MLVPIITRALHELHQSGWVHLQPHLSNFYLPQRKPYLVDWATAQRLNGDLSTSAANKALDIYRPILDFGIHRSSFFQLPEEMDLGIGVVLFDLMLQAYSENKNQSFVLAAQDAMERVGKPLADLDIIVDFVKILGRP